MLYVSHDVDEVARLADHIVVLNDGKILADGPLAATLARLDLPIHLGEEAGVVFAGVVAERDANWHLARVDFDGGSLWVRDNGAATGSAVRVRILARDVSIANARFDSSILNTLPAVLLAQGDDEHPGSLVARLAVGNEFMLARLTRRSAAGLGLADGMQVWVQIKAVSLH